MFLSLSIVICSPEFLVVTSLNNLIVSPFSVTDANASSNDEYMSLDYNEELNENKYFNKDFDVMKVFTMSKARPTPTTL